MTDPRVPARAAGRARHATGPSAGDAGAGAREREVEAVKDAAA